ncbi:retron Ec48 family effector membrane protein [Serratia symbiotica]|uniref:retron Ec48 family effector membrane protein n=1 Tax=Serratia symbiotica TaxID=138074 RepID=UPI001CEFD334|nr:retron Ec48 family effector membrane protein [Serratia symbiotica]
MRIKKPLTDIISYTIIIIVTLCFISMIAAAIIVCIDIVRTRDLHLCFSENCVLNAQEIFKTPISLLKQSLILIPIFVFFIGLYNYKLAIINAKNNNTLNKERDFYSYLKENTSEQKELIETLNKKKLYNALFDEQLNFKADAQEKIHSYLKLRGTTGLLGELDSDKKTNYEEVLVSITIYFGFNIEEEVDIERLDEITNNICTLLIEIIEVWFNINVSKK